MRIVWIVGCVVGLTIASAGCSSLHAVPRDRLTAAAFSGMVSKLAKVCESEAFAARVGAACLLASRDWDLIEPYTDDEQYFGRIRLFSQYVIHWTNRGTYDCWYVYDTTKGSIGHAVVDNHPNYIALPKDGACVAWITESGAVRKLMSDSVIGERDVVIVSIGGVLAVYYLADEAYWLIGDQW